MGIWMDLDIHVDLVDTVVFVCSIDILIHVGDTALLYWLVIQREAPYLKKSAPHIFQSNRPI